MAREDWRDHQHPERPAGPRDDFGQVDYSQDYAYDPRGRRGYRAEDAGPDRDDYGQADYSQDYAYDRERGRPYRRFSEEDRTFEARHDRSWIDKAGDFLSGRPAPGEDRRYDAERAFETDGERREARRRRRGPSDRVLWAVIMERLERDRRVDLRDVRVNVVDGEVTLEGTVRTREGKRRIEDLADVDGVRNIQNNLRPRDADRRWTLL